MVAATSSAFKFSPLWNLTPLRSLKRQVVGLTCSQLSASRPLSSLVLGSRSTMRSQTLKPIIKTCLLLAFSDSRLSGSAPMTTTILPVGVGPLAAVVGVAGTAIGLGAAGAAAAVGVAGAAAFVG